MGEFLVRRNINTSVATSISAQSRRMSCITTRQSHVRVISLWTGLDRRTMLAFPRKVGVSGFLSRHRTSPPRALVRMVGPPMWRMLKTAEERIVKISFFCAFGGSSRPDGYVLWISRKLYAEEYSASSSGTAVFLGDELGLNAHKQACDFDFSPPTTGTHSAFIPRFSNSKLRCRPLSRPDTYPAAQSKAACPQASTHPKPDTPN